MALVRTTLSSACAAADSSIVVASATGFTAGYLIRIDQENMRVGGAYVSGTTIPVIRGQDGTIVQAHVVTASVVCGTASDWSTPTAQTHVQYPIAGRARTLTSYTADGAIALPTPGADAMAVLNSTVALAMTLATPTKDMDGCFLWIVGNGKAAHVVTPATALNDAGSNFDTAITFASGGRQVCALLAMNEFWSLAPSVAAGTLTNVSITYS